MAGFEDQDGQDDGEAIGGPVAFSGHARARGDVPWLRPNLPPWHMWGNRERLAIRSEGFGVVRAVENQLTAIRYARPETWHWLFVAELVSVSPAPLAIQVVHLVLDFFLTSGVGRSSTTLDVRALPAGSLEQQPFDRFAWQFDGAALPNLIGTRIWSTTTNAPNKIQSTNVPQTNVPNVVDQIVGQDINLQTRVSAGQNNNYVYDAVIEVAAYWAPKTHIRPDWYQQRVPKELMFPGAEVPGR